MGTLQISCYLILLCLVGLLAGLGVQDNRKFAPYSRADVEAQPEQPAGRPLVFAVKLTNTGKEPIQYMVDLGAGEYPAGSWFTARITDDKGKTEDAEMSNDSGLEFTRTAITTGRSILPGESITFPAFIRPFSPGVYTIQVRKGKTAQVTVKDDVELARKWTQEMLAKIRKGDGFAQLVAVRYPTHALTEALLRELSSDNVEAAYRARLAMGHPQSLPDASLPYIKNAIHKQLALAKQRRLGPKAILQDLTYFASQIGSDEALEAVLEVARTDKIGGAAIASLGNFKQEAAVKELRHFLSDPNEDIQFRAAQVLAKRKDKDAVDVILNISKDPSSRWRGLALKELAKMNTSP